MGALVAALVGARARWKKWWSGSTWRWGARAWHWAWSRRQWAGSERRRRRLREVDLRLHKLCEGGELLDRILATKDSRYSEKDAARMVRQMLNIAARCHLNGVVHRDMKSENFLFKSTKEDSPLKATDFGLFDYIKPGKRFRDVVGSAYYVAPEVLNRRSGPESDVWSIGVSPTFCCVEDVRSGIRPKLVYSMKELHVIIGRCPLNILVLSNEYCWLGCMQVHF